MIHNTTELYEETGKPIDIKTSRWNIGNWTPKSKNQFIIQQAFIAGKIMNF